MNLPFVIGLVLYFSEHFLHSEVFAEIRLSGFGIIDEFFTRPFAKDSAFEHNVRTVHDVQGFAHVVVGDDNAETLILQVANDVLNVFHG